MTRLKSIFLLSCFTLIVQARADLAFSLTPAAQSDVGSNEVFFAGVLSNSSATDNLFLNNVQFSFTNAATNFLNADTNVFFANVPGILLPGEIYSDVVFGIGVNSTTPPAIYFGSMTIQSGTNIFATTNLSTQTFQVSVPPATLSAAASRSNLVFSWPSPPGNFVLQQNPNLTTTNWATAPGAPVFTNGQNQIIISPSGSNQFYRLKYP